MHIYHAISLTDNYEIMFLCKYDVVYLVFFAVLIVHLAQSSDFVESVLGDNKIRWVPHSQLNFSSYKSIKPAGLRWYGDKFRDTYVARVTINEGYLVGRWLPREGNTIIAGFNGEEKKLKDIQIELLSTPRGTVNWVPIEHVGHLPIDDEMMIHGGVYPRTGEKIYVCRTVKNLELLIGMFLRSTGTCRVAHHGSEHQYEVYELLVKNMLSKIIGTEEL